MKLTVKAKKIIALVLVVCIAMPLIANAGLFDGLRVAASLPVNTDVSDSVSNEAAVDEELMQAIIDSGIGSNLAVSEDGDFITSSSSVIDAVATDIVKNTATTGTEDSDDDEDTAVDTGVSYGYTFAMNEDAYTYDFFKKFTFLDENNEEKEYVGVYNDNIKKTDDNINLAIEEIGSVENPYVIVEVSPSNAISEVRPHVGDQGFFDLDGAQINAIELEPEEIWSVKLNLLYDYTAEKDEVKFKEIIEEANKKYNAYYGVTSQSNWYYDNYNDATIERLQKETVSVLWSMNTRGSLSVEDVIKRMEANLISCGYGVTKDEYDERLAYKLDEALEYKISTMRSNQYSQMTSNFGYDVDFQREYQVDSNGNFIIYDDSTTTTKEYPVPSLNAKGYNDKTNVIDGEYALTTQIKNPAIINSASWIKSSQVYISNYSFRKACLDLAFDTTIEDGKAVSQEPYIDEYIFAGWYYVNKEGSLEKVKKDTDLTNVEELYTSWSIRKFGETQFTKLLPDASEGAMQRVEVGTGKDSYKIYLPKCIASINTGKNHDPRNQLEICIPVKTKSIATYQSSAFDEKLWMLDNGYDTCVERYSSWDFDFSRSKYNTGEKLLNVAPALMADTDYRVLTYNTIVTVDEYGNPNVEYRPYNVQVITVTPNELNKLVYADYADSKTDADTYIDSDRVDKFFDNVDFIFFTNGGINLYYGKSYEKLTYRELSFGEETYKIMSPNVNRAPGLYHIDEANDTTGELTLTYVSENEDYQVTKKYKRVVDDATGLYTLEPVGDVDGTYKAIADKDSVETLVVVYDSYSQGYESGKVHDLEWQVAFKIYLRAATPVITSDPDGLYSGIKQQGRRIAFIISGPLSYYISGKAGASEHLVEEQSDGTYEFNGKGYPGNLFKMLMMFYVTTDPTRVYDYYVRDRNELKYLSLNKDDIASISYETIYDYKYKTIVSGVRGDSMVNYKLPVVNAEKIYKGTRYTGYLYGLEVWNQALFFPYEMLYDTDPDLLHETVLVKFADGSCKQDYYRPENAQQNGGLMAQLYEAFGIPQVCVFMNIANPYAYTYNGDNSMSGDFFDYTIPEIANPTNGMGGNTYLAFDYFREIRPFEIVNGKIATRSAIEFMVQNSQNGIITYMDRFIEILNDDYSEKYQTYKNETVKVDTVVVDDFSKETWNINYQFSTTSKNRYYVVEYLWTKYYRRVDNDNVHGNIWYTMYTKSNDENIKWYVMPKSSKTSNAADYYKTKVLNIVEERDESGNLTDKKEELTSIVVDNIIPDSKYYFEALIKPNVLAQSSDATYIIAVKQYKDEASYEKGDEPLSITLKNVALDKMSHMFYLD